MVGLTFAMDVLQVRAVIRGGSGTKKTRWHDVNSPRVVEEFLALAWAEQGRFRVRWEERERREVKAAPKRMKAPGG